MSNAIIYWEQLIAYSFSDAMWAAYKKILGEGDTYVIL
jgi:hypothetical protein